MGYCAIVKLFKYISHNLSDHSRCIYHRIVNLARPEDLLVGKVAEQFSIFDVPHCLRGKLSDCRLELFAELKFQICS